MRKEDEDEKEKKKEETNKKKLHSWSCSKMNEDERVIGVEAR